MIACKRTVFAALTSASLALCGAAAATAGPAALTDRQLDNVTAGGVEVLVTTDAAGVGAFTLGGTSSNAVVVGGATTQQPGLTSGAGLADGSAIAVGSNFGLSGQPAAGTATNVQTAGAADGNQVINATVNNTMTAGGVTMQAGWTFVLGLWTRL